MALGNVEIREASAQDVEPQVIGDQPPGFGRLSAREHQVVVLVGEGRTRKEVAFELNIAHSTVRVLYSRARKKLMSPH